MGWIYPAAKSSSRESEESYQYCLVLYVGTEMGQCFLAKLYQHLNIATEMLEGNITNFRWGRKACRKSQEQMDICMREIPRTNEHFHWCRKDENMMWRYMGEAPFHCASWPSPLPVLGIELMQPLAMNYSTVVISCCPHASLPGGKKVLFRLFNPRLCERRAVTVCHA